MKERGTQLVKGTMTILVLSALVEQPMHGYRLVRELEQKAQGLLSFKEGTVYPLLYSLEDRGLVEATWETGATGRQRKVYRVTQAGEKRLGRRLEEWHRLIRAMELVRGTA